METKTPCALLVNDIHISKDNISEFFLNWEEAVNICISNNIKNIIVGGDLWQSRSAQTLPTLMAVRQAILKATIDNNIIVTLAVGNHDGVDQESVLSYNHIFSGYSNVCVVDEYIVLDISDNVRLYVMSYFPENGSFAKRLQGVIQNIDISKYNIMYCHQGIRGGLATASEDELPASLFKPFDVTLVGHYHNRKKVDGTTIEYIGSSRQHNFGEDEEKGYTIVYDDGSYNFIKNQANLRYKVIDVDIADMTDDFLMNVQKLKDDGKYKVKVRISCQSKQANTIDKQKLTNSGVNKIELVTEQTVDISADPQSISKKYDKQNIKQEYCDFCDGHQIENVDLGLQYLDKIN